jgi:HD superfamily phosphohydrolase
MEIRDVIHGSVIVDSFELPILDSKYFQRLRQIKQTGFAEYAFPSSTHNRYIHSLGAMNVATQAFDSIFGSQKQNSISLVPQSTCARFRALIRFAALLHDVGHGPLSHTTEIAMPEVKSLQLPLPLGPKLKPRQATHEDYTLKMILDSGLTPLIEKAGAPFGLKPVHVASLIDPKIEVADHFFLETISGPFPFQGETVDFRPILKQLISSELDADRMDYLRRDSLHAGVSYGQFDFHWLVSNLTFHLDQGKCYLALQHRALYAFEDFLISRFHMFLMVYFHHKCVVFDEMLKQYFSSPDCDYQLPSDIEEYCDYTDSHLFSHLSKQSNPWAKRVTEKRPFRMLIELHSGIPATRTAKLEQQQLLEQVENDLDHHSISYLKVTSTSELSKYFRRPEDPIFVRYNNLYSSPSFIPLQQCTDLFQRYGENRSITRLYIPPESYSLFKKSGGRQPPLKFEENFSS